MQGITTMRDRQVLPGNVHTVNLGKNQTVNDPLRELAKCAPFTAGNRARLCGNGLDWIGQARRRSGNLVA